MNTVMRIATAAALTLGVSTTANAEVYVQKNSVKVGYELLLNAGDNNANLYDQGYLSLTNTTVADWGTAFGWITLENPLNESDNQKGDPAGATVKAWLKLDYNIGDTPFNVWVQSFTNTNAATTEENFYLGGSYDVQFGKLKGTVGLGGHYGWGTLTSAGTSFHGATGYAAVIQLGYPLTESLFAKGYYEGQFNRSDEHQTIGYSDNGYQVVVGLDYSLSPGLVVSTLYKHRDNWGGCKTDGGELFFEMAYNF